MRIVSNHCYAAHLYKTLGIKYNGPFIWSLMLPKDFLKLVENLDYYMNLEPQIISKDNVELIDDIENINLYEEKGSLPGIGNYPVVKLGDINIHFIHNDKEHNKNIHNKFTSRTKMFLENKSDILFVFVKSRYSTNEDVEAFKNMNLKNKFIVTINEANKWNTTRILKYLKKKL